MRQNDLTVRFPLSTNPKRILYFKSPAWSGETKLLFCSVLCLVLCYLSSRVSLRLNREFHHLVIYSSDSPPAQLSQAGLCFPFVLLCLRCYTTAQATQPTRTNTTTTCVPTELPKSAGRAWSTTPAQSRWLAESRFSRRCVSPILIWAGSR